MDGISNDVITLFAACFAAIISLASAVIAYTASRSKDQSSAQIDVLSKDLTDISDTIYGIVALSQRMSKSKTDKEFTKFRVRADNKIELLDHLRRCHRYSLWGLDPGFRTLQWVPNYISHNKNDRHTERVSKFIALGTSLRVSIDKAVLRAYFRGKLPSARHIWVVKYKAWRLRQYFDAGCPNPQDDG